ncbi:hypothetical protein [Latilactobacillus curvatus]|uniref:hypothetical protein n=1 Tax=Latilactobacillus curvatus TaxID=28038 RepID=UPI0021A3A01C|nr:hypothetical protein [Latilactobacillus curvatus]MCT3526507.1 hypothetical protein [Latilactobacillus curvatus]MDG2986020.1 hypothetical protein [Latilactobacillus curvatus]WCZ54783.1 hypothetical protein [Latilactobacillus phage TMW 1.591 P1]
MYVLVGVKSRQVIAESDYRSELNRERINKQPNEPTMIIPKDKLEQSLKPESVEELRDKYYAVDYWQRQLDETTKAYHARVAVKVRQLIEQGYKRNDVMAELGINTGLLSNVQTEYGILFKKRSTSTVAERRKKMIELLKSGMPKQDVAKAVGRSVDAVQEAAKLYGFKIPRQRSHYYDIPHRLIKNGESIEFESAKKTAEFLSVSTYKLKYDIDNGREIKGYKVIRLDKQGVK